MDQNMKLYLLLIMDAVDLNKVLKKLGNDLDYIAVLISQTLFEFKMYYKSERITEEEYGNLLFLLEKGLSAKTKKKIQEFCELFPPYLFPHRICPYSQC